MKPLIWIVKTLAWIVKALAWIVRAVLAPIVLAMALAAIIGEIMESPAERKRRQSRGKRAFARKDRQSRF